jgi:hypothetical protein
LQFLNKNQEKLSEHKKLLEIGSLAAIKKKLYPIAKEYYLLKSSETEEPLLSPEPIIEHLINEKLSEDEAKVLCSIIMINKETIEVEIKVKIAEILLNNTETRKYSLNWIIEHQLFFSELLKKSLLICGSLDSNFLKTIFPVLTKSIEIKQFSFLLGEVKKNFFNQYLSKQTLSKDSPELRFVIEMLKTYSALEFYDVIQLAEILFALNTKKIGIEIAELLNFLISQFPKVKDNISNYKKLIKEGLHKTEDTIREDLTLKYIANLILSNSFKEEDLTLVTKEIAVKLSNDQILVIARIYIDHNNFNASFG